jgi:hypothetical protein
MKFKLSKESVKQLRGIVSNEANEFIQEQAEEVISFESNPMEYILNKYPSLNDTLSDLLTDYFRDYVTGVFVVAPKPTTFKVLLHNGQIFFLIYGPKSWIAKIVGKRYYLLNLNEEESAIEAIARLLELGRPPGAQGPDEATSGESANKEEAPAEEEGGEEAAAGGEEEAGMTESIISKKIKLILEEILEENGISLNEAIDDNIDTFENFIKTNYLEEDQTISGLDSLYNAIQNSPEKNKLFSLIQSSGNRPLRPGKSSIQNVEGELFNLIMSSIKMKNGDPSELWFAIMYSGKAKGGVAKGGDIESDVDVDGIGVSIKNYTSISNLDFGSLPANELKQLKQIINLLVVLTGVEFTAGLGRDSINNLLKVLKTPSFQNDLENILRIGEDTQIPALKNMYNTIVRYLPNRNVDELVDEFVDGVNGINKLIADKITKVKWWAIISKNSLYLESSDVIASRLHSNDGQLSPVFRQIKGNNLFVNGNRLLN